MTLVELFHLLKKHMQIVVLLPIVCAAVVGLYSVLLMPNQYTATSSMYVLAQGDSTSSNSLYSDLNASQMLTNDVAKLLQSDRIESQVGEEVGVENLKGYKVEVTSATTSRVITLSVTGPNAETAADIVNRMIADVSEVAQSVMNVQSINPVEEAKVPDAPSGPNRLLYTLVALVAGLFAAIVIVVVSDMLNTKVRGSEDLEELVDVPVIGRIPNVQGGR